MASEQSSGPLDKTDYDDITTALRELQRGKEKCQRCRNCGMQTQEAEEMIEELEKQLVAIRNEFFSAAQRLPQD